MFSWFSYGFARYSVIRLCAPRVTFSLDYRLVPKLSRIRCQGKKEEKSQLCSRCVAVEHYVLKVSAMIEYRKRFKKQYSHSILSWRKVAVVSLIPTELEENPQKHDKVPVFCSDCENLFILAAAGDKM